ncbi:Calcineurin-like phosphoesterase, partial [Globisporangium splendens]
MQLKYLQLAAALVAGAICSTAASGLAQEAETANAVDDSVCKYDWKTLSCTPAESCKLQYKFGDVTPSQACRVNTKADSSKVPQQFHLAYAGSSAGTGMTISWTTFAKVNDPTVWIGSSAGALKVAKANIETKSYYSDSTYSLYNYHATVSGLTANTKYFYKVGSAASASFQSDAASFTTARAAGSKDTFELAVYGDFGVDANAEASNKYVNALAGKIDFIYHVGDISYADNSFLSVKEVTGFHYEETYNRWMNSLTPVMQQVPYMVLVGNHEAECHSPTCIVSGSKKDQLGNYTAYNTRFKMPSAESGGVMNMWYSFDYASVHFTTISSETDYQDAPKNAYTGRKNGNFGNQMAWLEADLKKANENRGTTPWLIVGMHRALYTLRQSDDNGVPVDEALPVQKAFEELFIKYKVDLVVCGHVHAYERHYPIARSKPVLDGVSTDKKTYKNPKAPVYIISGATGSSEAHASYKDTVSPWNVKWDNTNYGIGQLKVTPSTLSWKFIASESSKVLDDFVISKTA